MRVIKRALEKKIEEWFQRGLELERRGIVPGVTGAAGRISRINARTQAGRFYRDLVVRMGKNTLKIAVVGKPEAPRGHVSLAVVLDLPLQSEGGRKGARKKAIAAIEAFVRDAIAESVERHEGQARKAGNGSRRVKPA